MISPVFRRTRATRFAQLLDEAAGARRKHTRTAHDAELESLVVVSQRIASVPDVAAQPTAPDPDFRATLRRRLVAVAATQGIGAQGVPGQGRDCDTREVRVPRLIPHGAIDPRPGRAARVSLAVVAIAGVITLSGVSAASGDAMPGQTLYDVKRSTERAQLALAGSDLNRGQLHLEFATTRLAEAAAATDQRTRERGLTEMDSATLTGLRLLGGAAVQRRTIAPLDAVDAFIGPHQRRVAELATALSGADRSRALESLTLLSRVEDRTAALRQSLRCTNARSVRTDELGPVPGRCIAAPYRGRDDDGGQHARDKASRDRRDLATSPRRPTETATPRPAPSPASPSSQPFIDGPDLGEVPRPVGPPPGNTPHNGPPQQPGTNGGLLDHLGGLFGSLFG